MRLGDEEPKALSGPRSPEKGDILSGCTLCYTLISRSGPELNLATVSAALAATVVFL